MPDRTQDIGDPHARIERFLAAVHPGAATPIVTPLAGDASDRRYFRVQWPDGRSEVLAVYPGAITFEASTFGNVSRLLGQMDARAPRVLGYSDPLGIVALQDLGDLTLYAWLGHGSREDAQAFYADAVTLIHLLQLRGAELASPAYVPFTLAFDVEKLLWELHFFVTHFVAAHRAASLTAPQREALDAEFLAVTEELAAEPRVLCHRDFHSRNLMVHDGHLWMIDFQDARLGPDTYDLASLLRDSYVELDEAEVERLIAHFRRLKGLTEADSMAFRTRFDLMALQRNLKALGTFGFQATSRRNAAYLQHVPRTLAYVRSTLERYSRFSRLRQLLAEHLTELR